MTWLRRRTGDGDVVTTVDAWLNHRLTGAFVTDAATASRTMLLDLDRADWSRRGVRALRHRCGGPAHRVVDCDAAVGETEAFGPTLPVTGLVVDQQAALFAESCFASGRRSAPTGPAPSSWPPPVRRPSALASSRLAACVAWTLGGRTTYCLDGQVYTAASAVTWLEQARSDRRARPSSIGSDRNVIAGVIFVPALAGLAAPFWEPEARGGWVGLSLATDREDLVRAVVWGIAAQVASLAHAIGDDLGRPLERLRVDGGLSRSSVLMQAQADLLQAPVERYPSPTRPRSARLRSLGSASERQTTPAEAVGGWTPAAIFEPGDRMPTGLRNGWRGGIEPRRRWPSLASGRVLIERGFRSRRGGGRRRRRRRGDRPGAVPVPASMHGDRGQAGRGRGDQQGEHGAAAHGLRCQARHPRIALVRRGYRALARITHRGWASPSSGPARCSWRGRTSSCASSRRSLRARAPMGYDRIAPISVAELARREPHLGPGALGALEVPDEADHLSVHDPARLCDRGGPRRDASSGGDVA